MQDSGWRTVRVSRSGITTLQIIVSLVILGILTAVAVPRYFEMTTLSKQKILIGGMATGRTVCSAAFARESVLAGARPTVANVRNRAAATTIRNHFNYTYIVSGESIQITVAGQSGSPVSGVSTTLVWNMPPS